MSESERPYSPPPHVADDFPAIASRLKELEAERAKPMEDTQKAALS